MMRGERPTRSDRGAVSSVDGSDPADVEGLTEELDALADAVASPDAQVEIQRTKAVLAAAADRGLFASGVRRLRRRDVAEAFLGSVVFATPLLVEDGVFAIADHLVGYRIAGLPVFLVANILFVVLMTHALVSWTGRDREETHRLAGVVPMRVAMILAVSFVVTTVLMTVWGRLGDWRTPAEALARVNVLWTVGSIGAALGDLISDRGPARSTEPATVEGTRPTDSDEAPGRPAPRMDGSTEGAPVPADVATTIAVLDAVNDQFDRLQRAVDDREERLRVHRIRDRTAQAAVDDLFGDRIRKYTTRDIAEAFVGSVIFSIPLLVEDGVFDVADYFLAFRVVGFPIFFLLNAAFVLFMVTALVYWAGPQDVEVSRPVFGVIPRRLVGITAVSFVTVAALMTLWGRVDGWGDPLVAVARISAVWSVASFGAALGDILPGESSGDDINDDLADLGTRVEELVGQSE